jgi:hypothetical protein
LYTCFLASHDLSHHGVEVWVAVEMDVAVDVRVGVLLGVGVGVISVNFILTIAVSGLALFSHQSWM